MRPAHRLAAATGAIATVTTIFAAASGVSTGASATPVSAPGGGNNGDFKIDGPPFDPNHDPSNEPHVDGCTLQLDFYN